MSYAPSTTWAHTRIEEPTPALYRLNARHWRRFPRHIIEREMRDRAIDYGELFARLYRFDEDCGTAEKLEHKIQRGRFSVTLFIKILVALECDTVALFED